MPVALSALWNVGKKKIEKDATSNFYFSFLPKEMMERYEILRTQILESRRMSQEVAFFICNGMMEWIKAWEDCSQTKKPLGKNTLQKQIGIPCDLKEQIVILLADMAISSRKEVWAT